MMSDTRRMQRPAYLPFESGRWRLSMGLMPMDPDTWIEIDENLGNYLRRKGEVLRDNPAAVLASIPGSEDGQREVLDLLLNHLAARFPDIYRVADDRIENSATGEFFDRASFEATPLALAGRLVQEDLCLLEDNRGRGYILTAGTVCFPLRWSLAEKIGQNVNDIHDPVPGYYDGLARSVNLFFDRLKVGRPVWRLNWSIVDTPELFLPESHRRKPFDKGLSSFNAGERLWFRVERQTLRRLERTGGVLFTIRTYITPLRVLGDFPDAALGLAQSIRQMPPEMRAYKNVLAISDILLEYLSCINRTYRVA